MKGLGIGLLAGIALGWLIFRSDEPPPRLETERAPVETKRGAMPAVEPDANPVATRAKYAVDDEGGLNITRENGRVRYVYSGRLIESRPLTAIETSLAEARREKNWPEFQACLLELIVHGGPQAHAKLVEIMRDETLRLPAGRTGPRFFEGLAGSDVEGIATAAMARAKMELEEQPRLRWSGRGFMSLAARFGGAQELAWLETLRTSRNRSREVDRALAEGAANPAAAAALTERLLKERRLNFAPWRDFARANPAAAFDCAARMVARGDETAEPYRMLGEATTADTLPRAHAALAAVTSREEQLLCVQSVEGMRRRGLDTSGFVDIIDAPRQRLAQVPQSSKEQRLARAAIRAIRDNQVAWTEANLEALRSVSLGNDPKLADDAAKALKSIADNRSRQSGWDPERTR